MSEDNKKPDGEKQVIAYVDNKHFLVLMKEQAALIADAIDNDKPKPKISEEIGKIILDISTNLSWRQNFMNYTFKEDMISDGIENCINYLDNFDSVQYSNPFAYFTQICWYAFLRRIAKEGRQTELKAKYVQKFGRDLEAFDTQAHDTGDTFHNTAIEFEQDKE